MALTVWDYVVFGAFLLISIGIGFWFTFTGGRQRTMKEYMLADGKMHVVPVTMSLMTSFISAITIMGTSSETYLYGTQYLLINIGYLIALPIVGYIYLPVFFNDDKISVYQYLDRRFGPYARIAGASAFSLNTILYMGVVLYAPSLSISVVTGVSKVASILIIGIGCAIYSAIGGIKGVMVTDLFQSILMFLATFALIGKGIADTGSLAHIFSVVSESGHIEFFNFSLDPTTRHTIWSTVIGGTFTSLSLTAVNQAQVQRLRSLSSLRSARWALAFSHVFLGFLSFCIGFIGLIMYAHYQSCDPLLSNRICKSDQLITLFAMQTFEELPGLMGFFLAGLMAGSISTISTAINSLSAVFLEDFIQPVLRRKNVDLTPTTTTLVSKLVAFFFGILCIGVAFLSEMFTSVLTAALTIFGVVGGPLLGLFTLGIMMPFTSEIAATSSFLIALAVGLWMGFGTPKPPVARIPGMDCPMWENATCPASSSSSPPANGYFYLYEISYLWYGCIGFVITIVLGVLISLCFPQRRKVDPSLLSPVVQRVIKVQSE